MEEGTAEGFAAAPAGDVGVVAAEEDGGDAESAKLGGAGVVGTFEESGGGSLVGNAGRRLGW